ncbi:hypothetical protein BH20BAC1_BH20BAC1_24910 [soil metagenome]
MIYLVPTGETCNFPLKNPFTKGASDVNVLVAATRWY